MECVEPGAVACRQKINWYQLSQMNPRAAFAIAYVSMSSCILCCLFRVSYTQGRRSYVFFLVRTHPLFSRWVRIGIGPTHFLRWIVYYCVCIQHGIDKSQISFIELCKTLRTNSGLRAINSCLHLFWPQLCNRNICAVSYVCACVWLAL